MGCKTYSEKLRNSAEETGSIVCCGVDPAPKEFPIEGVSGYDSALPNPMGDYDGNDVMEAIVSYVGEVCEEMKKKGVFPGTFKPNLGYFAMYDEQDRYWGSKALDACLRIMRKTVDVPIILDAKDADIARSSAAYAVSKLKKNVDAMTVHPEMGTDSVEPFAKLAKSRSQGIYALTRTSNPGAKDFQTLEIKGSGKLYEKIAEKVIDWGEKYPGTVGSVVGATSPKELKEIAKIFHERTRKGNDVPLLIPGVGTQGGTAEEVMGVLNDVGYDLGVVRINSSSGIMYRAQKDGRPREEHAAASVEEIERLNDKIGFRC